jgi:hypothetical protein
LTFTRSDVGKRYSSLAYSPQFYETVFGAMYKDKQTPDARPILEREFKARFPSMTFKFQVTRKPLGFLHHSAYRDT